MKKKIYNCPQTEVKQFNTLLMQLLSSASMPSDTFNAPAKREEPF